jgi:small subunit ribosomal protein S3
LGQKVNPHGMRVGVIDDWDSNWFAEKDYAALLVEDARIRQFLKKHLFAAGIAKIGIKRASNRIRLSIYTAKPGMVIGRGGAGIEDIKKALTRFTDKEIDIDILEVKSIDMSALLVAENIASQLERRIGFRRAVKQAVGRTMRSGAKGIKVTVSGRLGGAEIARSESYREGSIPLQTLRANIDYGVTAAHTTYGAIGVKVWIYKGELAPGVWVDDNENVRTNKDRGHRDNRRGGRRGDRRDHRDRKPRNTADHKTAERSDS